MNDPLSGALIAYANRSLGSESFVWESLRLRWYPFPLSQEFHMSYRCEVCGKQPSYGKSVSFSHKRANRRWLPNIQKVRVKHGNNTRRARVCTSCIGAGKIEKA